MVTGFHRSISLPSHRPTTPIGPPVHLVPNKSYHVRSTSLPARFHPIITQLDHHLQTLKTWQSGPTQNQTGLTTGLAHIESLLTSLHDLLHLASLRPSATWTESLLDDFLILADAHGTFRSTAVMLKQCHATAQIATRRRDEAMLQSCMRSQRRAEREIVKLASDISHVAKARFPEAELSGTLMEVMKATVAASASVFLGTVAISSSSCSESSKMGIWVVGALRRMPSRKRVMKDGVEQDKRRRDLERLMMMEDWLGDVDAWSGRVFRGLVNTRVSLLNILSPTF